MTALLETVVVDTSVAVPMLLLSHSAHDVVRATVSGFAPILSAQSLAETYSVLTRLPGDARARPADVVLAIDATFGAAVLVSAEAQRRIHRVFAAAGVGGGAVYDALVGLAAAENGLTLLTRDVRAKATYHAVGAKVRLIGS